MHGITVSGYRSVGVSDVSRYWGIPKGGLDEFEALLRHHLDAAKNRGDDSLSLVGQDHQSLVREDLKGASVSGYVTPRRLWRRRRVSP
jgi:hypothetical protein